MEHEKLELIKDVVDIIQIGQKHAEFSFNIKSSRGK